MTAIDIRTKIATDNRWLVRAILALYERQTEDEQRAESTDHRNDKGFNAADAPIMSSFAKQILDWRRSDDRTYASPLSPRQLAVARRKLPKYAGQLARIAAERAAVAV